MYDAALFARTVSEFARTLLAPYDVDAVLDELAQRVTAVLGLAGSGVTVAVGDTLQVATTVPPELRALEQYQVEHQDGPCMEAFRTSAVVAVADIAHESARWPGYARVADDVGVSAVAGVPMRIGDRTVGALNLYSTTQREWTEDDLTAAQALSDLASGYLALATTHDEQRRLNHQLQGALDSRVVIEQAKGVLAEGHGITVDAAFGRMRTFARDQQLPLREVARRVVAEGLRP